MKYKTDLLILVLVIIIAITMLFVLNLTIETNAKVHSIVGTLNEWQLSE